MKKLICTSAAALMLMGVKTVNAQKIAHINVDSLVSIMPEAKALQDSMKTFYSRKEKELAVLQTDFQNDYQKYVEAEPTMSETVKKVKQEDLQRHQARIEELKQTAQQDLQEYQGKLIKPIQEKVKAAIKKVAKQKEYKYVLDTSLGVVIYSEPTDDIFNLVKAELKIPDTAKPVAPASQPKK